MKMQEGQQKFQLDMMKMDKELQQDAMRSQMKVQESAQIEANQRAENVREAAQRQMVSNTLKPPQLPAMRPNGKPGGLP